MRRKIEKSDEWEVFSFRCSKRFKAELEAAIPKGDRSRMIQYILTDALLNKAPLIADALRSSDEIRRHEEGIQSIENNFMGKYGISIQSVLMQYEAQKAEMVEARKARRDEVLQNLMDKYSQNPKYIRGYLTGASGKEDLEIIGMTIEEAIEVCQKKSL